jgi:predicted Zn-ribbon and HTH transcriptional regulator
MDEDLLVSVLAADALMCLFRAGFAGAGGAGPALPVRPSLPSEAACSCVNVGAQFRAKGAPGPKGVTPFLLVGTLVPRSLPLEPWILPHAKSSPCGDRDICHAAKPGSRCILGIRTAVQVMTSRNNPLKVRPASCRFCGSSWIPQNGQSTELNYCTRCSSSRLDKAARKQGWVKCILNDDKPYLE